MASSEVVAEPSRQTTKVRVINMVTQKLIVPTVRVSDVLFTNATQ